MAHTDSFQSLSNSNVLNTKLQFLLPTLPRSEHGAAAYIAENLDKIGYRTLSEIAAETNSSSATIIRLCKRMGYKGFLDFRNDIRHMNANHGTVAVGTGSKPIPSHSICQQLMLQTIEKNIETMQNTFALYSDQYDKAADALRHANVIAMFGNGDAIIPCNLISMKLMKLGKACMTYSDQDLQVFCASTIHPGDVALAVSHTGRSKSVVEAMRIAQARGAITIGITGTAKSPLLKYCLIALHTATADDSDAGDIISRRIAEQTVLETLYMNILFNSEKDVQEIKKQGAEALYKMMKLTDDDTVS